MNESLKDSKTIRVYERTREYLDFCRREKFTSISYFYNAFNKFSKDFKNRTGIGHVQYPIDNS